jgi:hypothetical protein
MHAEREKKERKWWVNESSLMSFFFSLPPVVASRTRRNSAWTAVYLKRRREGFIIITGNVRMVSFENNMPNVLPKYFEVITYQPGLRFFGNGIGVVISPTNKWMKKVIDW